MKTPAGTECKYYYQDFHRGRDVQECRLAQRNEESLEWQPADCARCRVPEILWANASPDLRLRVTIRKGMLGLGRRVDVQARCEKHSHLIEDPIVGCKDCAAERPGLDVFFSDGDND